MITAGYKGFCPEANKIFSAMTAQTTVQRKYVMNNLIEGLKKDGVWSKLDLFYVMAVDNRYTAKLNWINPQNYRLIENNSPLWTANIGYSGNGSTSYLDTNWSALTNGVTYTLNSASMGAYTRVGTLPTSNTIEFGFLDTSNAVGGILRVLNSQAATVTGTTLGRLNSNANTGSFTRFSDGLFCVNRSASNSQEIYVNGTLLSATSISATTIPGSKFLLLGSSGVSVPIQPSNQELSFAFVGGSLTAGQHLNLYNRIYTFLGDYNSYYDPDSFNLFQATTATTTTARKQVIDTYIRGLKRFSLWNKFDCLWVTANSDRDLACLNWTNPYRFKLTPIGTGATAPPLFTVDRGFSGNGSSNYIDTNFSASTNTHCANYLQANASMGCYTRVGNITTNNTTMGFADQGNGLVGILSLVTGSTLLTSTRLNAATNMTALGTFSSSGLWNVNRSGNATGELYNNGLIITSYTISSTAVVAAKLFLLARSSTNLPNVYASNEISMAFIGGSLTSGDTQNLYTLTQAYMTSLGAQV